MLNIEKDPTFVEKDVRWGYVDARFPSPEQWQPEAFFALARQELDRLRASMADETVVVMQNIGLGNLSSRLRLLYEGRARLEIDSVAAPERRTTVRILIPKEAAGDVHNADH